MLPRTGPTKENLEGMPTHKWAVDVDVDVDVGEILVILLGGTLPVH